MKLIEVIVYVALLILISASIVQTYVVLESVLESSRSYKEQYSALKYVSEDFMSKTKEGLLVHETERGTWTKKVHALFNIYDTAIHITKAKARKNTYIFSCTFMLKGKSYEVLSVYEGSL